MTEDIKNLDADIGQASGRGGSTLDPGTESRLENARERFAKVASGVEEKVGKLKQGAGGAKARARESAEKVGAATRERYESTVENVRQSYDKVQTNVEHITDDVNEYVRENPGRSVLIAAGVGFLIGMLLRGGRR